MANLRQFDRIIRNPENLDNKLIASSIAESKRKLESLLPNNDLYETALNLVAAESFVQCTKNPDALQDYASIDQKLKSLISESVTVQFLVNEGMLNGEIGGLSEEISKLSYEDIILRQTSIMKETDSREKFFAFQKEARLSPEVAEILLQSRLSSLSQENIEDQEFAGRLESIRQSLQPTSEGVSNQQSNQEQTLDNNTALLRCNKETLDLEGRFQPSQQYDELIENLRSRLPQGEAGEKLLHMIELTARNDQYANYMNSLKTDISDDEYSEDRTDRLKAIVVLLNVSAKDEYNNLNPDNVVTDSENLPLSFQTVWNVINDDNETFQAEANVILRNSEIATMTNRHTEMNGLLEDTKPTENDDLAAVVEQDDDSQDDVTADDIHTITDEQISQLENNFENEGYRQARKGLEIYLRDLTDSQKLIAMVEDVVKNEAYMNMLMAPSSDYDEIRIVSLKGFLDDLYRKEQQGQSISEEMILDFVDMHNNEIEMKNDSFSNEVLSQRVEATRGHIASYRQDNINPHTTSLDDEVIDLDSNTGLDSSSSVNDDSDSDADAADDEQLTQGQQWDKEIKEIEEQFANNEDAQTEYNNAKETLISLLPKDEEGNVDEELVEAIENLTSSRAYAEMFMQKQLGQPIDLEFYQGTIAKQMEGFNKVIEAAPDAVRSHAIISAYEDYISQLEGYTGAQENEGVYTLSDRIEENTQAIQGYFMRANSETIQKLVPEIENKEIDYAQAQFNEDEKLKDSMALLSRLDLLDESGKVDPELRVLTYQLAQNETYRDCVSDLATNKYNQHLTANIEKLTTELVTNQVLFEELGIDVTNTDVDTLQEITQNWKAVKQGLKVSLLDDVAVDNIRQANNQQMQEWLNKIKQEGFDKSISDKVNAKLADLKNGEKIEISPQVSATTFAVHNHELGKYAANLHKNTGIKGLVERVKNFDDKMTQKYPKMYPIVKNICESGGAAILLGAPGLAIISAKKTAMACIKVKRDAQKEGKGFFEYLHENKAVAVGLGLQAVGSVISGITGFNALTSGSLGIIHQGAEAVKASLETKIARTSFSSLGAALAQSGINEDLKNGHYLKAVKKIGKTAIVSAASLFVGEHMSDAISFVKEHWPFGHNEVPSEILEQSVSDEQPVSPVEQVQEEQVANEQSANLTKPDMGLNMVGNKNPFIVDGVEIQPDMPEGWHPPMSADQGVAEVETNETASTSVSKNIEEAKTPAAENGNTVKPTTGTGNTDKPAAESGNTVKPAAESGNVNNQTTVGTTGSLNQSENNLEGSGSTNMEGGNVQGSDQDGTAGNQEEGNAVEETGVNTTTEDLKSKSLLANRPEGYSTGESTDIKDENGFVVAQSYDILDDKGQPVAHVEAGKWRDDITVVNEQHNDGTVIQTTMDGNKVALMAEFKDGKLIDIDPAHDTQSGIKYTFAYDSDPVYCETEVSADRLSAVMPNGINTSEGTVVLDGNGSPMSVEAASEKFSQLVNKHDIYNDLVARQSAGETLSSDETTFMTHHQQEITAQGLGDKDGQLVRTEAFPNSEMRNNMYNQFLDRQKQGLELTPQQQQFMECHERMLQQNGGNPISLNNESMEDKVSALRGTDGSTTHLDYSKFHDHQDNFGMRGSSNPADKIKALQGLGERPSPNVTHSGVTAGTVNGGINRERL